MHLRSWHLWCLLLSFRVCQPGWNVVRWSKFNFMNFITFLAGLVAQPFQWARPPVCMYMMFSGSGFGFFCFLFSVLWFLLLSGTCASGFGVCCTFQVNSFVDKRQKCERKRTKSVSFQSQSFSGVLWRIDLSEQHLLCKVWTMQFTSSGVVLNLTSIPLYDNARISPNDGAHPQQRWRLFSLHVFCLQGRRWHLPGEKLFGFLRFSYFFLSYCHTGKTLPIILSHWWETAFCENLPIILFIRSVWILAHSPLLNDKP